MNIASRISLYDFLAMMVCGYLLLFPFAGEEGRPEILFGIVCFVAGLIYHHAMERLFVCCRNNPCLIRKCYLSVRRQLGKRPAKSDGTADYLASYYRLMRNGALGNIPILEAHVAFIRNLLPIVVLYVVMICCGCPAVGTAAERLFGNACGFAVCLTAAVPLLVVCGYRIQCKIHRLVWEGGYFMP